MREDTELLVKLINENKSLNEISNILGLSNKQIFMRLSMLKNSGFIFDRKYYYNGDIRYSLHNPFVNNTGDKISVITPSDTSTIRIVLISDTHLGHKNDDLKAINSMYEYCIKNDIHLVFNLGDFFDGIDFSRRNDVKFDTTQEQISYVLKEYPYDKNILNFVLLGNHDQTFWIEDGIDINTILTERRHDIISLGYGYNEINVGGCNFKLRHALRGDQEKPFVPDEYHNMILLFGHSHKFKTAHSGDSLTIYVPALSSVSINYKNEPKLIIPSMIDMQLFIKSGKISTQYLQQFIFINNEPIRINEITYNIPMDVINPVYDDINNLSKNIQQAIIDAANNIGQSKVRKYTGMSQTQKFNTRYNR